MPTHRSIRQRWSGVRERMHLTFEVFAQVDVCLSDLVGVVMASRPGNRHARGKKRQISGVQPEEVIWTRVGNGWQNRA